MCVQIADTTVGTGSRQLEGQCIVHEAQTKAFQCVVRAADKCPRPLCIINIVHGQTYRIYYDQIEMMNI